MREIRSRISQQGIELSAEQIQDLAARRLEAILDPRTINPTLVDQLRKGAAVPPDPFPQSADAEYSISDDAIYEGGAVLRFLRRLFSPLLKLLFNPAPLVAALQAQARLNREATARAAELTRRQAEWNALHYQIVQRLVTEVSRGSIETQSVSSRIESLTARVDFNDRRVRALETAPAPARNQRPQEIAAAVPAPIGPVNVNAEGAGTPGAPTSATDGPRRRRRRRRGRRGSSLPGGTDTGVASAAEGLGAPEVPDDADSDEGDEEDSPDASEPVESVSEDFAAAAAQTESAAGGYPVEPAVPALAEPAEQSSAKPAPIPAVPETTVHTGDHSAPAGTPAPPSGSGSSEH
jgi:hypothetical protein